MKKTALIIALVVLVAMLSGLASGANDAEFQKAVDHYKAGQYEEAVRVLENYVQKRPEGSAYYLMGYANYALGREEEAARNFRDAYLVDPEFSPGEFRRTIGIDAAVPPKSPPKPRVEAPAAPAEKPAPAEAPAAVEKPVAKAPPPVEAAPEVAPKPAPKAVPPAPKPRVKPSIPSIKLPVSTEFIVGLGLIPLIAGLALYFYFSLCLFLIARKTDVSAAWTAFIPILQVWPMVGAAGKPAWWIVLLIVPVINIIIGIYLWMLIAERLGRGKIFGLLIALIPVLNLILLGILAFKRQAVPSAMPRLELPEIPDEFPPLPGVPGMEEEETPFGGAAPFEEVPPEEKATAEEEEFGGFPKESEEIPEEFLEEEERTEGKAEEEMAPFEEFPSEEEPPRPFEEAAPFEAAEPWQFPEEEPLEYEALEEAEAGGAAGLIGIGDLFKRTFGVFAKRVPTLILITLLSYLLFGVGFGIFMGAGVALGMALPSMREGLAAGGVFAGVIAGLIASFWGYGAMVFGVADDKLGVVDAYRRAWQKVGSFIWIYILLFFIIIPGGMLLFLIPGILFIVWFSFAPYILAKEDLRGMSAAIKSKEYVRGYFGDVFLRFLPLLGLLFVVWLIQWMLAFLSAVVPVAPQLVSVGLSLVITPFVMIYMYLIYQDLKGLKGDVAYSASGGQKAKWLGLGCLGWIVGPIIFFLLAGAAVLGSYMLFKM